MRFLAIFPLCMHRNGYFSWRSLCRVATPLTLNLMHQWIQLIHQGHRESTIPKIPGGNSQEFWRFSKIVIFYGFPRCVKPVFFKVRFGEEHWTLSNCPIFCFVELLNDLLGLEVSLTDSISNLFSITVNMTYGNTSLQIALLPLWNSYCVVIVFCLR